MSFHGLASKIAEAAGPLLPLFRKQPPDKQLDAALARAQEKKKVRREPEPPLGVGEILSVQHVVHLIAHPPLIWHETKEPKAEWRCDEATRLTVRCADGSERVFDLPAGSRIPVAAGMIHLPRCEATGPAS